FSKMGLNIGGYYEAINAVQKSSGPSWRMVVELTESGPKAWGVYPGGQSGNPASPFFDNFISHWSEGRYYELFFMKNSADTSHPVTTKWTFSN
ncbi:MAG TPA: penicillin acylase family protein, partial [Saprospiraceae bacterium]|nr:penicillin acylase family protein [Saprospiraceae bacterium]